jgi:hypothetical protein
MLVLNGVSSPSSGGNQAFSTPTCFVPHPQILPQDSVLPEDTFSKQEARRRFVERDWNVVGPTGLEPATDRL